MADFIPLTLDELPHLLSYIVADMPRNEWIKVATAIKSEFGDSGFPYFDDWSQTAGKKQYDARNTKTSWRGLDLSQAGMGFLVNKAKERGWIRQQLTMSREDRKRIKAEQEARRVAHQQQVEADAQKVATMQEAVSAACTQLLTQHCDFSQSTPYLEHKQVGGFGVLEVRHSVLFVIDDQRLKADLWTGGDMQRFFAALPDPRPDHLSFFTLKPQTLIIPLCDAAGKIWCIQYIQPSGKKLFPRYSRKSGCFHVLGGRVGLPDQPIVSIAEGYATAATIHEAMGWPVVMCVDSGNLLAVAQAVRDMCPKAQVIIAGDDDRHHAKNPGRTAALAAAVKIQAHAVFPLFTETGEAA